MTNGSKAQGHSGVSETRFSLLEQRVGGVEEAVKSLTSEIKLWMESRQRSPWQFIALLLAILVPLGWIFNVYITSAISPVNSTAVQALATANTNVAALARFAEVQTKILTSIAEQDAERRANEREVETQIDAMNQSLSVQFANQQRMNADLQNALHDMGAKMPVAPSGPFYFPNISNRNHRQSKAQ